MTLTKLIMFQSHTTHFKMFIMQQLYHIDALILSLHSVTTI